MKTNFLEEPNSRLELSEQRIIEFKDRSIEHMQAKEQREKRKNGSGGNISQLISWGQYYPHTETRWRHPNNRTLETNISCDYGCKNPQKLYQTKPNGI